MTYLDHGVIDAISDESYRATPPYPWISIQHTLTEEGFQTLRANLPNIDQFQRRVGVKRAYGQGYHDRSILHFHPALQLAQPWREFVAELQGAGVF